MKNSFKANGAAAINSAANEMHICSITGEIYYGYGNNAWPFSGRCSDYANKKYVIPFRLAGITPEFIKANGGNKKVRKSFDEFCKKRA